jgi:hypothetical protein
MMFRPMVLVLLALALSAPGPAAAEREPSPLVNRLSAASSAYLRSSATSPVAWQEWGSAAFRLARVLDRPVLLGIGAGWCHWCHVMDRGPFGDAEMAALINERFVPVKLDRDERPDIDARYQHVARAAFGTGGWPLILLLTPDGKAITGSASFLAEGNGPRGLRQLLTRVSALYRERRHELTAGADAAHRLVTMPDLSASGPRAGGGAVDEVVGAVLGSFDAAHGGFGEGAQHSPAAVLGLLFRRYGETTDARAREAITRTLDAMAAGAVRDQLDGGFFRYTTDRQWRAPHFEKLDHVQAQMLIAYLRGYQMTGERRYRVVAEELLGYIGRVLTRPDAGFRAYQDADGAGGDAGHYLVSAADVESVLPREQAQRLVRHLGLSAEPRAPAVEATAIQIAADSGATVDEVEAELRRGKHRLRDLRARRGEPRVDDTVYADRNGLMASAYLEAYRVLGDERARDMALGTLDLLGARLRQPDGGLAHAAAAGRLIGPGLLTDQVAVAQARLDAFEATGDGRHLAAARELMRYAVARFWDATEGGFFDRAPSGEDPAGASVAVKPFLDDEMPAGNPLAAIVLERLYRITGEEPYERLARLTLAAFPSNPARLGPLVATYAEALDRLERGAVRAVIVGARHDPRTDALTRAAQQAFRPGKVVLAVAPGSGQPVPAPVAAMLAQTTDSSPRVYLCTASICSLPVSDPARVRALVESFGQQRR